ncbi:MAG: hypothetical protein A2126_01525 [Candidatus Woykebacteria bacterium GWB1_45_5]|uniref:Cytochrome b561 domain-containing protein n=2 Tax=Candidatus Woykeibacteriota TaxID=1817899 RepID=A0A1G1W2E3_9BACT|nr:MAG: hypothetical protein A2113_00765 [Candidatus Woykebacteria bacterium GWA1_44_8]OGY22653.1 MAG: hypothetical protein A2126_01525 [Candidatus Woykebacteria bacterium GWB1_45_5]
MSLPDPIIFSKPLHVWLGILTLLLLIIQISLGIAMVKTARKNLYRIHTKVVWMVLIIVALIHAYYGFQIYFLK